MASADSAILREKLSTLCNPYRARFLRRHNAALRDNGRLEAPNVRRTLHRGNIFRGYGEREQAFIPFQNH